MPTRRNAEPDDMDRGDSLDRMDDDESTLGERGGRADDEDEDEFDPTSRGDEDGEVM